LDLIPLEYSEVKVTIVFVHLRIYSCDAKIPNKLPGAVAGERLLYLSSYPVVLISFVFLYFYLYPLYHGTIYYLKFLLFEREFLRATIHPILTPSYKIPSDYITKVQELSFSRSSSDNPYHHLREFEQICPCIAIAGMSHDTLKWKLFPFSLVERAKQWCMRIVGSMDGSWDKRVDKFCLRFFSTT
jgi:hypothetical protein